MFRHADTQRDTIAQLPGVESVERRHPGWVLITTADCVFEITTDDPDFDFEQRATWYVTSGVVDAAGFERVAAILGDTLLATFERDRESMPCSLEIRPRPHDGTVIRFPEISTFEAFFRVVDALRSSESANESPDVLLEVRVDGSPIPAMNAIRSATGASAQTAYSVAKSETPIIVRRDIADQLVDELRSVGAECTTSSAARIQRPRWDLPDVDELPN